MGIGMTLMPECRCQTDAVYEECRCGQNCPSIAAFTNDFEDHTSNIKPAADVY
jgi:hypothetical protein